MEADISILHKPGHFYFALTSRPKTIPAAAILNVLDLLAEAR